MKFEKIHNKGQAKLFESQYLEMLTKTHPLVIWGMYMPLIVFFLYYSHARYFFHAGTMFLVFMAGAISWTLFEYCIHRFAFHFAAESPRMRRIVYVLHGNHHEYPRDRERLFMPPVPSLILACIVFSLQYFIMGEYVYMFFPGFLLGYLMYGTMHFAIHAWHPPFKWMKPLWRNHHLHHYKNEEMGFGVSSTLWDLIFGTMFDLRKEKEDKEKVKELMF
ncbi:MAG: sterol desaturase family protein [Chitinophagaceae bacterium]|nr:sterol desaturase family protein [Chitinophagaceae bacterium]